jgi:hypothetical protein
MGKEEGVDSQTILFVLINEPDDNDGLCCSVNVKPLQHRKVLDKTKSKKS